MIEKLYGKNINFLIGSGASFGVIPTLSSNYINDKNEKLSIEEILEENKDDENLQNIIYLWYYHKILKIGYLEIPKENTKLIEKYKEVFKNFIYLVENNLIYINDYYIEKNSKQISISQMSTGEKNFLYHLFFIMTNIKENTIIIWEEPETHLNKLWSKQLIPLLTLLYKDLNVHFLISSHETVLINSLFSNQILLLKDSTIDSPNFETFLTNENEIISNISEKSEYNLFEEYIIKKLNASNQEELKILLNNIGDSFLRFLIYQKLK